MLIRIWIGSGESFALFALRVFVDHCRLLVCECGCFHHRQHHTTVVGKTDISEPFSEFFFHFMCDMVISLSMYMSVCMSVHILFVFTDVSVCRKPRLGNFVNITQFIWRSLLSAFKLTCQPQRVFCT